MSHSITALAVRIADRFRSEDGQALSEYGLILGLAAVVTLAAVTLLGTAIVGQFDVINVALG
ncbi:MAG TPA: Flp family type IVb pilin [Dehalococcoidia bacterium]|jgi:pilus assembly protein Flp/PilA